MLIHLGVFRYSTWWYALSGSSAEWAVEYNLNTHTVLCVCVCVCR